MPWRQCGAIIALMTTRENTRRAPSGSGPKARKSSVELADRAGDGFVVTLNWDRDGVGSLWVSVFHEDTGETFVIDAPRDNALDVFYHPFAYNLTNPA